MLISYGGLLRLQREQVIANSPVENVNGTSIDITLGDDMLVEVPPQPECPECREPIKDPRFARLQGPHIQPHDTMKCTHCSYAGAHLSYFQPVAVSKKQALSMRSVSCEGDGYILLPGQAVLAHSVEQFNLPLDITAEYRLKSSMARVFLEHLHAGWCFTGGTLIPLLNGTEVPIKDLVGQEAWVYSLDEFGEVVPGRARDIRKTRVARHLVDVALDNGKSFTCTPDHLVMLRDGKYKEAQALTPGEALMPYYTKEGQYGPQEVYGPKVIKAESRYVRGEPVYDMAVDDYHNFALSSGVFVHNCDPGWSGSVLTLELMNMSRYHPISLKAGMKIGQVCFYRHDKVPERNSYRARGQYNNDTTVAASRGIK